MVGDLTQAARTRRPGQLAKVSTWLPPGAVRDAAMTKSGHRGQAGENAVENRKKAKLIQIVSIDAGRMPDSGDCDPLEDSSGQRSRRLTYEVKITVKESQTRIRF